MPKCISGPSFFDFCFEHAKKSANMEFRSLGPSPWGPLKVHNTGTRSKYKVPGRSARCVQVRVRGAKCRCGVQVQGKRYRKGTRYTVHGAQRLQASFAGTAQYTPNTRYTVHKGFE